jgi:hypothetical protein
MKNVINNLKLFGVLLFITSTSNITINAMSPYHTQKDDTVYLYNLLHALPTWMTQIQISQEIQSTIKQGSESSEIYYLFMRAKDAREIAASKNESLEIYDFFTKHLEENLSTPYRIKYFLHTTTDTIVGKPMDFIARITGMSYAVDSYCTNSFGFGVEFCQYNPTLVKRVLAGMTTAALGYATYTLYKKYAAKKADQKDSNEKTV